MFYLGSDNGSDSSVAWCRLFGATYTKTGTIPIPIVITTATTMMDSLFPFSKYYGYSIGGW